MENNTLIDSGFGFIIWTIINLILIIAVAYFAIKFYIKIMTYLDKSIKLMDKKLDSD